MSRNDGNVREYSSTPSNLEASRRYNAKRAADPAYKEWQRQYNKEYYLRNKDKIKAQVRRYRLANNYNTTEDAYTSMVEAQSGRCAICHTAQPLHVDHDHETGKMRGLLCSKCNIGLGQFDNDPDRLRAAADYLTHMP